MAIGTITIATSASKGGTTQAPVFMSDTAPSVPGNGSLWFNTATGRMYVFYDDGSSTQWVQLMFGDR
jgi:hypothetical protein